MEYKRKTVKMTKNETKRLAGKNNKMTDWVKNMGTPGKRINEATELVELEIAPDMEWRDATDIDRASQVSLAWEKSETIRRKYEVKIMMTELVEEMVRIAEATSVISSVGHPD